MTAFLGASTEDASAFLEAVSAAAQTVVDELAGRAGAYSGATPAALGELLASDPGPEPRGRLDDVLREVGAQIVGNSINTAHPRCAAHLHCPPLIAACAAEVIVAATNQSLDSWDQSPAATHVEQDMIDWLSRLYRLGPDADGVFTSGGTQSNLMGLLLARDRAAAALGHSVTADGLPQEARAFRIVCSDAAHFSVLQSARLLGLGDAAIVTVPRDAGGRMDQVAAARALERMTGDGDIPIAVVATAGTTDLGTIDALPALASLAADHGAWLHVDAAVGGVLATSERERGRLEGLELADSIAIDFHKLWFQPISCAAFLVREADELKRVLLHADYLNPEPVEDGPSFPNLVDKSLQTTRRFDALKLRVSLEVHGTRFFGEAAEATIDLARAAARLVEATDGLELAAEPQLNTVLFRHEAPPERRDALNLGIRQRLLLAGEAVVAQTRLGGETWLKLTLMNPLATEDDVAEILRLVVRAAAEDREQLPAGYSADTSQS